MNGSPKVVAVVVTWNRKDLLARNLRATLAQTRPVDAVLVVDNASTDGTADMLAAEFPSVRVIRLAGNAGSAGGFHVGVREGLAMGADWLWLMDDDGVPTPECLAEQLRVAEREGYGMCGALLLDLADPRRLAFPPSSADWPSEADELRNTLRTDHVDTPVAGLWNGTLLCADAARRVGPPKAEMFIWGEEHEYSHRLLSQGQRVGFALLADYLHPADRFPAKWLLSTKIGGTVRRKCRFCDPRSPRAMVYVRNLGYNDFHYHGWARCAVRLVGGAILWLRTLGPRGALAFARYYLDGATNRYVLEPARTQILAHLASGDSVANP